MNKTEKKWLQHKLRELTLKWSGRNEALKRACVRLEVGKTKKGLPKYLNHYTCAKCSKLFRLDAVQVDHIEEVGDSSDFGLWADRLFCATENLQVLCELCHKKKTARYNARTRIRRDEDLI